MISVQSVLKISGFVLVFTACLKKELSLNEVKITNPIPAEEEFPYVVRLDTQASNHRKGTCSATFITSNILLTAAHCFFDERGKPVSSITYTDKSGTAHQGKIYSAPTYDPVISAREGINHDDLGQIEFSKNVAPAVAELSPQTFAKDMDVTLVGYGRTSNRSHQDPGPKHYGHNTIEAVEENISSIRGYPYKVVLGADPGEGSVSAPGDSGGAMLDRDGKLGGVIIAGQETKTFNPFDRKVKKSYIININHDQTQNVLKDINQLRCTGKPMRLAPLED